MLKLLREISQQRTTWNKFSILLNRESLSGHKFLVQSFNVGFIGITAVFGSKLHFNAVQVKEFSNMILFNKIKRYIQFVIKIMYAIKYN